MIIALILLNNIERDEAFFKHGFQVSGWLSLFPY
jgi:hypothetical protein